MADIKDISDTIASALTEVGVTGTLDVSMEGGEQVVTVGEARGEAVEVVVTVKPVEADPTPLADDAAEHLVDTYSTAPVNDPATLTDTALLAEYHASEAEAGDSRLDALAGEIERRGLDV